MANNYNMFISPFLERQMQLDLDKKPGDGPARLKPGDITARMKPGDMPAREAWRRASKA